MANREQLKRHFETGKIPTQQQFAELIDSSYNVEDGNLLPNNVSNPLKIGSGSDHAGLGQVIAFYRGAVQGNSHWGIQMGWEGRNGLALNDVGGLRLFIEDGTGNVGIGTNTPAYTLDVKKSVDGWLARFQNDNGGAQLFVGHGNSSGAALYVGSSASSSNYALWVGKGGNPEIPYLLVRGDGNVGIGTNTPVYKLEITDESYLTSDDYINGKNLFRIRYNSAILNTPSLSDVLIVRGAGQRCIIGINYSDIDLNRKIASTSNSVKLVLSGSAHATASWESNRGDYADLFESKIGEILPEATSVVIGNDGKIRKALASEIPIGITTNNPAFLGNNFYEWPQKHLMDEFGNLLYEESITNEYDEHGDQIISRSAKLNPDFDASKEYIPRIQRPEWHAVGLIGRLHLRKGQPVAPTWVKIKDVSENVELWLVK